MAISSLISRIIVLFHFFITARLIRGLAWLGGKIMAAAPPPPPPSSSQKHQDIPSSSSSSQKPYDVFLSFRGDTRYGITSFICTALRDKKIETYFDEDCLESGNEISPALLAAIESSKISVIVFSELYATSWWCLSELEHINKCRQKLGQIAVPIFYKVDPSNVRAQYKGSYKDAFVVHENNPKHSAETVQEWRSALEAIGDISGVHYKQSDNRLESALVKEVVETILKILGRAIVLDDDFKGLIGMKDHFTKLELLLSDGSPKLQILGIWGMPGIGKTTIANAVSSRLSSRFESFYFLTNVKERSEKHGLERLRDELIAILLGDKNISTGILSSSIPEYTKERLRRTKVLLVLDDVSERKQLEHLVGNHFGSESLIIVTTRDEGVLRGTNIEADFNKYEVELLSFEESLELFNLTTFRESSSPLEYKDLSSEVVSCLGGNPLAITVFGSHLCSLRNPSKRNWEKELEKLKDVSLGGISLDGIQKVLRISYDGLTKLEKKIFLDIACFFKGKKRRYVENVLDACNFHSSTGIDNLIDKSLVTEDSQFNKLHMHDLVQQMGCLIVHEESEELGKRSRIWNAEDVCNVINNDSGSGKIEGIYLNTFELDEDVYMEPTVFRSMQSLRLLIIYGTSQEPRGRFKLHLQALEYFPPSLRYLEWYRYPLKFLPSSFNPRNIVELKLPFSELEQLWDGTKNLGNLRGLDLRNSINLTQIPDLSLAKNLETLNLENCTSLHQIPWKILQNIHNLYDLNLSHCSKLRDFPERIDARELRTLNLGGCVNLKIIPEFASRTLVSLNFGSTAISSVPSSIGSINTLSNLNFNDCKRLVNLPRSLSNLDRLKRLNLSGCVSLNEFPMIPVNIEKLLLVDTAVEVVPSSCIEHCSRLRALEIIECKKIESLPSSIFELTSLVTLDLIQCSNLKSLPEIPNGVESNLEGIYLGESGIRYIGSSIANLKNVKHLNLWKCRDLEFISNLMPRLERLSLEGCTKVKRISQLPFSLSEFNATGCESLETVSGSTSSPFRNGFWEHSREFNNGSIDYSIYGDCLNLKPSALHSIVAEFQMKVMHLATQYRKEKRNPTIVTCYPGKEIPDWFNFKCDSSDDLSGSVTIPIPTELCKEEILGFALCAVVAAKDCTWGTDSTDSTDIFCKMKLENEGELKDAVGLNGHTPTASAPFTFSGVFRRFPVAEHDQVIMWYRPQWGAVSSLREGDAEEVSFQFLIKDPPVDPTKFKLIRCGVHMILRKYYLEELSLFCRNRSRLIEVDEREHESSTTKLVRPEITRVYSRKRKERAQAQVSEGIEKLAEDDGLGEKLRKVIPDYVASEKSIQPPTDAFDGSPPI